MLVGPEIERRPTVHTESNEICPVVSKSKRADGQREELEVTLDTVRAFIFELCEFKAVSLITFQNNVVCISHM